MQSNTYTAFLGFFIAILLNFIALPTTFSQEDGDIYDLRFLTEVDCNANVLTADIQIRTQQDTFKIGISSVLFNYDENVLTFLDYQSQNFDQNNICIPGVPLAVWDAHQFSSSTPGVFNLTLLTEIASASCPIIETDWISIGTVRFTVKSMEGAPNMQFDNRNTSFNRNVPNDGTFAPTQGNLMGFNEVLATQCACDAPIVNPDTLTFDCPEANIEANLANNDIASNPTFSIISNPTKGTATITPNGTLNYTPTSLFCGEDVLTYRVCNDGQSDCCSEAVVTISFTDEMAPSFVDPPVDVTVECDKLPEFENVIAIDNCPTVDIATNETVVDGDCPSAKTHVRTWIATDACGNTATHTQMIFLIDTVEPTIECKDTFSILCDNVVDGVIDSGQPVVADNCTSEDGITVTFADETLKENCENKIQKQIARTWTATDACGNVATCIQIINVIDDIFPSLDCPRGITVNCGQDISPEALESKATAIDNCSEVEISFDDSESMPLDCNFDTKTIIRTWIATDACGNATSCSQSIIVEGIPCPDPREVNQTVYRCEKAIVNFKSILNIGDSLILSLSDKNTQAPIINTQQYALPSTGCEIGNFEFTYEIHDFQQCLIENGNLTIKTIPNFIGDTRLSEDGCTAELILECPDLYFVTWTAGDQSGVGTTFNAMPGTNGEVAFSAIFTGEILPSEGANLSCAEVIKRISFNCGVACPDASTQEVSLTTCAGQNFDIAEILNLSQDNLDYTFEFDTDILGISFGQNPSKVEIDNPFGCDLGTFKVIAKGYDATQCLIKIINISIEVLPEILGSIQYESDSSFCSPQLVLECPRLYGVDWKDNLGNSGVGNTYEGTPGTGGLVTFYVYPIEENLSELPCAVDSFFADFSCSIECPTPTERTENVAACAETEIDIIELLGIDENKRNIFDNENITNGIYKVNNSFGCGVGTKTLTLKCFDANQCLTETIILNITVIPAIYADIQNDTCGLFLNVECPENYRITWEDNHGNSGSGANYVGTTNTAGTVKFTVEFLQDSLNTSIDSLACLSQVFEGNYNCRIDCPPGFTEDKTFTYCSGDFVNILNVLDVSVSAKYLIDGIIVDSLGNVLLTNEDCSARQLKFFVEVFDNQDCVLRSINVTLNILPKIEGQIQYESDTSFCKPTLVLNCSEAFKVTWEDNLGNIGEGNTYNGTADTSGFVTFFVVPLESPTEVFCSVDSFFADFSCPKIECPTPEFETIDIYGCAGEIFNLFERLDFSNNIRYQIVDGDGIEDIKNIRLENDDSDCFIRQFRLAVDVFDERDCVIRTIFVSFNVLPEISGEIVQIADTCNLTLELTCPNIYSVFWSDDLGNTGEGFTYVPEEGTQGVVNFVVAYKDTSVADLFLDPTCYTINFSEDFACCNPAGTACDDGDALTFNDVEDGNCGCFGTGCNLEHKGVVIDGSTVAGCGVLIEMSDGTILEPVVLPVGETLAVGQEIIFSFVELTDRVSICQAGKIVQIICLENTCPVAGTPCSDNDLATINDEHDGNCNCLGESVPEIKSEIDLRLRPALDCSANTYCLTIQAKAQQEDFTIGTSSIMLNYDPNALEFVSYSSSQFDESETCIGGSMSPWDEQKIDGTSVPGKFCLTMTLLTDSVSCPEITTESWEDIGEICFDIMNNDTTPALRFDTVNTHFNSSSPNNGSQLIPLGRLIGVDMDEALACEGNTLVSNNEVALKTFLQGPYQSNRGLMSDDLRRKGFLPLNEPYTGIPSFIHFGEGGGEATTLDVLDTRGENAIVDWVFLELRSGSDSTVVVATRSALIQRDGDIVEVDGISPVQFMVPDGDYYICVKHRNHLGVMTAQPIAFATNQMVSVDFTNIATPTFGTHAQLDVFGTMVLRGGNANPDKFIILAGGGLGLPDRDMIFFDIFLSLWRLSPDIPITYNSVLHGYYGSDTNMDGKVKYQGPQNDIDAYIFFNVLFHPQNTAYRLNFAIPEQIP